ncbi:type I-E CRISPR-associated protein Cse2/CasB [Kitasatospora sp. YST-16]|uniref:type I-E CRISPR-associated protein Cse2/CasB n=1 Tax=Kitasatospora sp. YST-16 TaxID=2998080 RepID=UPI002284E4A7|nr:type I-E CRISPR-associated protein Cse2/CasB [Kitasatospora sp. YST-16]WAL70486.1 type I-E CRISPR-associated protein Cse2/CasB [Kitasatospora sp. YST-16]WNW36525.1 type I-E CRISPR-associated protein Cse2/CasB [Streptomyces sp. Li-HN-5-13]
MTTAPPAPAQHHRNLGPVGTLAGSEIGRLQKGYLDDRPDAVAALARLRRGAGKDTATIPDLWGLLDTEHLYADPALHQDAAHTALYTAATLYSLHQQSRGSRMHRPGGDELGAAVRRLMPGGDMDEPTRKRFVRAGSAATLPVLATRLREIVLLLRREDIALDYALLAEQLYQWQQRPWGPDSVRRSWGRSLHAHRAKPADPADVDPAADGSTSSSTDDRKDSAQ